MNKLWIAVCLLVSTSVMAQQFSKDLEGKMVPAKIIFGDGVVKDILMKYQAPEFYKNPQNKFTIKSDVQDKVYNHSGGIEAFMVDGNVWALRPVENSTQFVVMTGQGAIEKFTYIKYDRKPGTDEENFVVIGSRIGTITHKVGTNEFVDGEASADVIRKWISDSPEVLAELNKAEASASEEQEKQNAETASEKPKPKKKGLMGAVGKLSEIDTKQKKQERVTVDLGRIINNYNALYEANNPGNIKYYFIDTPENIKAPVKTLTMDERKVEAAAKLEDQYASRSTTPSPEIASAKENQPVKKENFAAKMQRIKGDGNKVGVILYLKPAAVPKAAASSSSGPSMMMKQAMPNDDVSIEGEYLDESLLSLGQGFTDELNKALGTSDIELIDINKIPYKDMRMGRIDDWWATKYKVVFAYTVDPRVTLSKKDVDGKSKSVASVNVITSLLAMEYIGTSDSPKQKVVAQILNMGSFVTPEYSQEEDMTDIKEVYEKTIGTLDMPVSEKIKLERADPITKLVEKKLK